MTQIALPPFARHSETSRLAAIAVAPKVSAQEAAVLDCLDRVGPSIEHVIAAIVGIPHSSVCARVNALCKKGLIRDSGERALTPYNRKAVIWELAP